MSGRTHKQLTKQEACAMIHIDRSEMVSAEAIQRANEARRSLDAYITRQKECGRDTRHAEQLEKALAEALRTAQEFPSGLTV
jgi:hypothetical protein